MTGTYKDLGALTAAQRTAYEDALVSSHRISLDVDVYDGNEDYLERLDAVVISGQVDADITGAITKTLALEVADPGTKFTFDPLGTLGADRFVQVWYKVWVDSLALFVRVPVFYGPVSHYSRNGSRVSIEAQGKEALLLPPVAPYTPGIPASRDLSAWLKSAAQAHGEERFGYGFATDSKRLPKDFTIQAVNELGLWPLMLKAAAACDRQLYYDGRGFLCVRPWPRNPARWVFEDVLDTPAVSFDLRDVRNTVKVYGADNKGHSVLRGKWELQNSHPLSARSLARNGKDRILLETVKTDNAKLTPADAKTMAKRIGLQKSQGVLDVSFSALPVPHLELGDVVRVSAPTVDTTFVLKKFSLPLTGDGAMSVGRTGSVSVSGFRRAL